MTAALTGASDKDQPPFKPTGFDPDPPHMSALAAGLSVIAPGAGQIFNGDDEEALGYGLTFFLIKPWVESVRDARRRGEKIATYWLERPPDGALLRSLRYVLLWWVCVGAVVAMLVGLGNWGWEVYSREPVVDLTDQQIATAMTDAHTGVGFARIEALRALSEAQLDVPSKRFTMTDEERAERLFLIGYQHCDNHNFGACERIMRRVATLSKGNVRAFRLQAWASAAQSGNVGKFPEVPDVPTLSDFETEELSLELGVTTPKLRRDEHEVDAPAPNAVAGDRDGGVDAVGVDAGAAPSGTAPAESLGEERSKDETQDPRSGP